MAKFILFEEEEETYNHTDFHHFGWCPLFGKIPEKYISDDDYVLSKIICIIDESRKIWINSANLKNISELPEGKSKKASEIWYFLVTNYKFIFINRKYTINTIEEETKYIIDNIRDLIISDLKLITDAEIMAIFTIYEATFVLDYCSAMVFYDNIEGFLSNSPKYLHVVNLLLAQTRKIATQTHGEIKKGKPHKHESEKQEVNNVFRWCNGTWEITYDGKTIRSSDLYGFWYIRCLLKHPGEKINAKILRQEAPNSEERKELLKKKRENIETEDIYESNSEDTKIDSEALASYKKRINELKEEIKEAERDGNEEELKELQEEYDEIKAHIRVAFNNKGRLRKLNPQDEKNRIAVRSRITKALTLIKREHPSLFEHLNACIITGLYSSYTPSNAISWITD